MSLIRHGAWGCIRAHKVCGFVRKQVQMGVQACYVLFGDVQEQMMSVHGFFKSKFLWSAHVCLSVFLQLVECSIVVRLSESVCM